MAPQRAVLQQHRGGAVRPRSPKQQTGRTVAAPVRNAAVGHHPSVTVAPHLFRICRRATGQLRMPNTICRNLLLEFAYRVSLR